MESSLQHEDLLIKLRAKLNEEKVKLWETPYVLPDNGISQSLQELAKKYATELSFDQDVVLQALHELQLHSIERSKANAEFKETGCATFRVKATIPGERPKIIKVQMKLDVPGSDLIKVVAEDIGTAEDRVKLIFNGKVIKPAPSLEEQGVKNGAQIMALIMAVAPEVVKKEDHMYMEMKATRDDATLLSEYVDDLEDDDEYIKLEDQSGKAVELPAAERRALMVGLALHERGRAAARRKDHALALLLLLEADRQLSECRSSLLKSVDNWAVVQLDVAWCYLSLQALGAAGDAALRLRRAEDALRDTYGDDHSRLIALKGTNANERVLFMRLYLLQGIVAYHQNKRAEAKALLDKAENELNFLRVDDASVTALMELGWTRSQARAGLRACAGALDAAHHWLAERRAARDAERDKHRKERQRRFLGLCVDGSEVRQQLVEALVGMGYSKRLATVALRNSNNHVAEAVRLIQEQPELLADSDMSSDESETPSSSESLVEPDEKLVLELAAMGYDIEEAKTALKLTKNKVSEAIDILVSGGGHVPSECDPSHPSTSSGGVPKKKQRKHKREKRKQEREMALKRLSTAIGHRTDDDDHLDASLADEEEYLAQYKSLL